MSCSVKSTPMILRPSDVGGQRHQFDAIARRHAGRWFVHQEQARFVGERHRELQALEVAISELPAAGARLQRPFRRATAGPERGALLMRGDPGQRRPSWRACDRSATCTFSTTVMDVKVAVI